MGNRNPFYYHYCFSSALITFCKLMWNSFCCSMNWRDITSCSHRRNELRVTFAITISPRPWCSSMERLSGNVCQSWSVRGKWWNWGVRRDSCAMKERWIRWRHCLGSIWNTDRVSASMWFGGLFIFRFLFSSLSWVLYFPFSFSLLGQHLKHRQGKRQHVVWGSFYFSFSIFFSELSSVFSIFILSAWAASETQTG